MANSRVIARLARLGGGAALVLALATASGCALHEDYGYDAYYADGPYAGVYGAPGYWYDGVYYYWYDDLWWYRYGDRWVILHNEPPGLYRWRTSHWGARPYGGYYRARPYYHGGPVYRAPAHPRYGGPRGGGRGRR